MCSLLSAWLPVILFVIVVLGAPFALARWAGDEPDNAITHESDGTPEDEEPDGMLAAA